MLLAVFGGGSGRIRMTDTRGPKATDSEKQMLFFGLLTYGRNRKI